MGSELVLCRGTVERTIFSEVNDTFNGKDSLCQRRYSWQLVSSSYLYLPLKLLAPFSHLSFFLSFFHKQTSFSSLFFFFFFPHLYALKGSSDFPRQESSRCRVRLDFFFLLYREKQPLECTKSSIRCSFPFFTCVFIVLLIFSVVGQCVWKLVCCRMFIIIYIAISKGRESVCC